jgi:hypothetical protein
LKLPIISCETILKSLVTKTPGVWSVPGLCDPVRISLSFDISRRRDVIQKLEELIIEAEYLFEGGMVLIPSPIDSLENVREHFHSLIPPPFEQPDGITCPQESAQP